MAIVAERHPVDLEEPTLERVAVGLARLAHKRRWLIVTPATVIGVALGVLMLLGPRQYEAFTSFIPNSRFGPNALAGLAVQFGVGIPTSEPTQSADFYLSLMRSHTFLGELVDARYDTAAGGARASLITVYRAKGATPALRREDAIRHLSRNLAVSVDRKSGIIAVRAVAQTPSLSVALARTALDAVNRFNVERRRSQAHQERVFAEERLTSARASLRTAEDRLQSFLLRNREYRNSPELTFQHDRLARDVVLNHQLVTTLAQAVEQARIDEVRDTPLITVVEPPVYPVRPKSRGILRSTIVVFVVVAIIGLVIAIVMDYWPIFRSRAWPRAQAQAPAGKRRAIDDTGSATM
jgi:uncharacterized protein involved in exopolysaccharide biosynthesis